MTITYRITFRDRLAFLAYCVPRRPLFILMSLAIFLAYTFGAIVPAMRQAPADKPLVVRIIAFIILELLLVACIVAILAVLAVLTLISRKNKPLYCQRTLTVSDDAFVTESEYGRSETRWSLVQKLTRTRSHIFMFVSQEGAIVIPRRAFENAAQWDTFYETCKRSKSRITGKIAGTT